MLTFSQSIIKLIKLWNTEKSDDALYSAIVNATESNSIREDFYISLPVKFENGTFKLNNMYNFNQTKNEILSEIIKVG